MAAEGGWQYGHHRYRDLRYPVKGLSAEKMNRVALSPANVCRTIGDLRLRSARHASIHSAQTCWSLGGRLTQ
jgi:hypothetical protein